MGDTDLLPPEEGDAPLQSGKGPLLFLIALVLVFAGLAYGISRFGGGPQSAAQQSTIGGPFNLIAADGSPFTEKNLAGKPYAIYFGYTRCPDVCPTSLARMARLRKQLGADGDKFAIVFVSVDPEHDKPAAIGEYVKLFGTPIIGLTGNDAQLKAIESSYGIYVTRCHSRAVTTSSITAPRSC